MSTVPARRLPERVGYRSGAGPRRAAAGRAQPHEAGVSRRSRVGSRRNGARSRAAVVPGLGLWQVSGCGRVGSCRGGVGEPVGQGAGRAQRIAALLRASGIPRRPEHCYAWRQGTVLDRTAGDPALAGGFRGAEFIRPVRLPARRWLRKFSTGRTPSRPGAAAPPTRLARRRQCRPGR